MNPIVSVIVPTKNRYKYLKRLIDLVDSFSDEEVELVVQDNSDDNTEILDFLKGKKYNHIKYFYSQDVMSMSQNAEMAVRNSIGDYVCFIGDDDAVCRNIGECARWMKLKGIDALRSLYLQYSWNEKPDGSCNGTLMYDYELGFSYMEKSPIEELKKVLKQGVPDFRDMAKFYHGIISRDLINRMREIGGTCFPGVTPDMSSAVSLSFLIKKYVVVNIPVVIPGMSKMVGGGVMGKVLTLDEVNFITDKDRQNWEKGFPKLWATELIWPDCAMKALRYVGKEDYIRKYFNKNRMLSRLVVVHRAYFKEAYVYANNKLFFLLEFVRYVVIEGFSFFWRKKVLPFFTGKLHGKYIKKRGFKDINEAEDYLISLVPSNAWAD